HCDRVAASHPGKRRSTASLPGGRSMSAPLLEVHDLHAGYGQSRVLHGMSLHVAPGEFITLLGRNGMGKSTTIKCIMGLLRSHSGNLRLDGRDITHAASHQIAR